MMKPLSLMFILLLSVTGQAQQMDSARFMEKVETQNLSALFTSDSIAYWDMDSAIFRTPILGFIGDDFQRMRIRFISIIKDPKNDKRYQVYGKSKVKNNICEFQGTFTIQSGLWKNEDLYGLESGLIKGSYELVEDSKQAGSGIFEGQFELRVKVFDDAIVYYPMLPADGYRNSQFTGNWTSFSNGQKKVCNWGDYRIPDSKELDWGAAFFSPHPDYYPKGWEFYEMMYSASDKPEAERDKIWKENLKKEYAKWW